MSDDWQTVSEWRVERNREQAISTLAVILAIGVSGLSGIYGSRFITGGLAQVAGGICIMLSVFALLLILANGVTQLLN